MALQVTLVKTPGGVSLSRTSHLFDEQGGTFGRADTNSWALPDPEKFLSSCHCEILWIADGYYLLDRSTNGTFLNGAPEPIGRGVKSRIAHGDIFDIGDYSFSVNVIEATTNASPFDNKPLFGNTPAANIFDEPFGHGSIPEAASLFEQPLDPLAMWEKAARVQKSPANFASATPAIISTSIDDIFGDEPQYSTPDFAQLGMSQSMDQAVVWPNALRENLIPEDWEDDFSDLGKKTGPQITAPTTDINTFQTASINCSADVLVPKPRSDRQPLAERLIVPEPILSTSTPPLVPEPSPTQVPVNVVKGAIESSHQPHTTLADCSFIQAMGLDSSRLTEAEVADIATMSGQLMREIVEGMMGVLRSRTSIKNEFRMNVTTIQPVENNPLKFSVSVDDALENMFLKKSNAYKKPVEAFKEGFQEIAEHQVAMIGGIRQGFERMMERFNPDNLEKNFNKQGRGGVIPGMQKAKYWSSYTDYYAGFTDNMESSFQHLFGSDFVSAYEDQLRRLAAARKKDKQ